MMQSVYNYMKTAKSSDYNPWSDDPSQRSSTYDKGAECRRTYHIFMTDGAWNTESNQHTSPANADGTSQNLGDGSPYDPTSNQTQAYADTYGSTSLSTLADFAFKSWAEDFQPSIDNGVRPLIRKSSTETISSDSTHSVTLQEFWNPKNDPATWQHVTTYTIGFGTAATNWPGNPQWDNTTDNNYAGDYAKLVNNQVEWPSVISLGEDYRPAELWHMALNGRGKYYPARDANALANAFREILNIIVADTSTPITGFASASSSIVSSGTTVYQSQYSATGWKGGVVSYTAAQSTGALTPNTAWGVTGAGKPKSTGDILDALGDVSQRVIYTYNGGGQQFLWSKLSTTTGGQQALLKAGDSDTVGQNRLNFLRGDRSQEIANGGTLRDRISREGDIVNSTLWYTGRPASGYTLAGYSSFASTNKNRLPMIYVGGNDGMLHGFSAENGSEKIAYIPQGLYPNLKLLTQTDYQNNHKYYVDGSPFTGDVNVGSDASPDWRTLLVGTLGAGGKGYFVLDVTKPGLKSGATDGPSSNFTNNDANAAAVVRMDKTDGTDADIGSIFGDPTTADLNPYMATQIARMNDGRWAVLFGNGYNSTNEDPVLVIQYLDGGSPSLVKIAAATGTAGNAVANGLSTPRPVDLNGDGTPDVVYAGDLKGNLWKFDVANSDRTKWGVAFSSAGCGSTASPCTPFYTATYSGTAQPITAAPNIRAVPGLGGMMVAFGTGKNLTEADRTDTAVQTFYALLDNTKYKIDTATGTNKGKVLVDTDAATPTAIGSGRSNLTARTFNSSRINGAGISAGEGFWNMTTGQTAFAYSGDSAKKGWYFDFPATGERLLQTPEFLSGSNVLQIKSTIPASGGGVDLATESCSPSPTAAKSFLTLMGIEQGLKPVVQLLDANGDGIFNAAASNDNSVNRTTTSPEEIVLNAPGKKVRIGSDNKNRTVKDLPKPATTINWRQLQ